MTIKKECIIVGAGITGLTAAFYLKNANKDFLVLEEADRVGGVIRTISERGFLFETGPNTGVMGQPEAAILFEDLGDSVELEIASSSVKKRYILKNGKWNALPSRLGQAIKTPLFSMKDKLRILGEPFRRKGNNADETLKQMVIRRMGKSYLDYAVDPFILGVYAGDPEHLVPKYALPKLYKLEQQYGSFIGGAIKKKFQAKSELEKKATREVFSVKGGLQSLINVLYGKVGQEYFRLKSQDTKVKKNGNGFTVSVTNENGVLEVYETKNVIITTGSHKLPELLPDLDHSKMSLLTNLRYAKVIEVAIGFNEWHGIQADGFGGLIPFRENRDLLGVLFPSAFLDKRAPEGGALFTVFIGGIRRPDLFELNDDEIFGVVKAEFEDLMAIDQFKPDLFKTFRYRWAIPQYEKSSGLRFNTIKQIEKEYKGLLLKGNFQGGIGLADRIRQGSLAAGHIIDNS